MYVSIIWQLLLIPSWAQVRPAGYHVPGCGPFLPMGQDPHWGAQMRLLPVKDTSPFPCGPNSQVNQHNAMLQDSSNDPIKRRSRCMRLGATMLLKPR